MFNFVFQKSRKHSQTIENVFKKVIFVVKKFNCFSKKMNKFTNKTDLSNSLKKKINSKKAIIGIIGLGYVGLPLALTFAKKKFKVIGFDTDKSKLNNIKRGKSYFSRITKKEINLLKKTGTFKSDYNELDINSKKPIIKSKINNNIKKIKNQKLAGALIKLGVEIG